MVLGSSPQLPKQSGEQEALQGWGSLSLGHDTTNPPPSRTRLNAAAMRPLAPACPVVNKLSGTAHALPAAPLVWKEGNNKGGAPPSSASSSASGSTSHPVRLCCGVALNQASPFAVPRWNPIFPTTRTPSPPATARINYLTLVSPLSLPCPFWLLATLLAGYIQAATRRALWVNDDQKQTMPNQGTL